MNFYRRYIKDLSLLARPLTRLLQKGNKFVIKEEVREAVRKSKEALCSSGITRFYTAIYCYNLCKPVRVRGSINTEIWEEEYPVAYKQTVELKSLVWVGRLKAVSTGGTMEGKIGHV